MPFTNIPPNSHHFAITTKWSNQIQAVSPATLLPSKKSSFRLSTDNPIPHALRLQLLMLEASPYLGSTPSLLSIPKLASYQASEAMYRTCVNLPWLTEKTKNTRGSGTLIDPHNPPLGPLSRSRPSGAAFNPHGTSLQMPLMLCNLSVIREHRLL